MHYAYHITLLSPSNIYFIRHALLIFASLSPSDYFITHSLTRTCTHIHILQSL